MKNLNIKIIKNRNYKNLRLSFKGADSLLLSAPKNATKKECMDFLQDCKEWILQNQKRFNAYDFKKELREDKIYLFGEWQDFCNQEARDCWGMFLAQKEKKKIADFYKMQLQEYLERRLPYFADCMQLFPKGYKIGKAFCALGKCSSKEMLNFSLQLAFMPKMAIDSVIIHELAHLKFMNHSKDFWNLVFSYDKNPHFIKAWLRENHRFHKAFFNAICKA